MNNFSMLVRKKYESLDSEHKQMFDEEFIRRKNTLGEENQNELALEILRDIALTFGNNISDETIVKKRKNSTYLPPTKKYKESYLFNYIYVLILGLIAVSAYTKPDRAKMENEVINKFLKTQPQFLTVFKNMFIGEEVTEERAETFIFNVLRKSGYKSVDFECLNWGLLNKLEISNGESNEKILVAYGFFGMTVVTFVTDELNMATARNHNQKERNFGYDIK